MSADMAELHLYRDTRIQRSVGLLTRLGAHRWKIQNKINQTATLRSTFQIETPKYLINLQNVFGRQYRLVC